MHESPARRPTTPARVRVVDGDTARERPDRLVTEEPMEIRVEGPGQPAAPVTVTMRTPGHDFELAVGFCVSEHVVAGADDVATVAYCLAGEGHQEYNVVTVRTRVPVDLEQHRRNFVSNSSCGLCGKTTLDQVEAACAPVTSDLRVTAAALTSMPDALRDAQAVFGATGAVHATGCFTADGELRVVREDVGRHNALDKVIGWAALSGALPLRDAVSIVSGRVSFEIVQKAATAGIPVVGAVSAPSSLAVQTAHRLGVTLIGFLRGERFNVYTHPERVVLSA
ncbi:MAG: formate dehydrogenase accessory sulfurtransferase FdhD [Actinomycetota bacterium]